MQRTRLDARHCIVQQAQVTQSCVNFSLKRELKLMRSTKLMRLLL
ncbi:Cell cycle protein GpsB [Bienertia sinuspersici]